jgi:ubiquinone biosynthesis protein UbiJ
MFDALQSLAATAVMERATLLVNHVLASELAAREHLAPHVGRCIDLQLEGWPALLPKPPVLAFRVTPAALVEWCGDAPPAEPELQVRIDASNPALMLLKGMTGEKPRIEVAGDALFATDVNWLFDNLRWDVEDDLAKLVGPAAAREIGRISGAVATAVREAAKRLQALAGR